MAGKSKSELPFNELAIAKWVKDQRAAKRDALRKVASVPGLMVRVKATGGASFIVHYQVGSGADRKRQSDAIGRIGELTLADAKAKALDLMHAKARGGDPIQEARDATKEKAKAITLQELFEMRAASGDIGSAGTLRNYRGGLAGNVFPTLGHKPAKDITSDMLVDVLEPIAARSKEVAHTIRSALSGTYRWGMQRRRVSHNPVAGLGFNHTSKSRKRRVVDAEIARLWEVIESSEFAADEATKIALKLDILLGQRGSEVVGAEISELELDGEAPRWVIQPHRMKRKSDDDADMHIVPLSTQAVALFRRAIELSRQRGGGIHVFPGWLAGRNSNTKDRLHLGRGAVYLALRRACVMAKVDDLRIHDFRKAVTTWLAERFERPDVLDRILHHKPRGVTDTHYNFATLEGPVRAALQRWADHVWAVTGQGVPAASNVVALVPSARVAG